MRARVDHMCTTPLLAPRRTTSRRLARFVQDQRRRRGGRYASPPHDAEGLAVANACRGRDGSRSDVRAAEVDALDFVASGIDRHYEIVELARRPQGAVGVDHHRMRVTGAPTSIRCS